MESSRIRYEESLERMKQIPQKSNIGSYDSKSGDIKSELKLISRLQFTPGVCSPQAGDTFYIADFIFYTEPQWSNSEEKPSVSFHYDLSDLDEVFEKIKQSEEAIEVSLMSSVGGHNWRGTRDAMRCILALEDAVKNVPERVKEAYQQRKRFLKGHKDALNSYALS